MIDVFSKEGGLFLKIGPHEKPIELDDARQLAQLLREDTVESIASFDQEWKSGLWKIEGADDDIDLSYHKTENRRRLLLHYGSSKWHILRREAVLLGSIFRDLAS